MTMFKSTDSGAKVLSGTVNALREVVSSCIVVNTVYTTPDDAAFTDRTAEARLDGGTAFSLLSVTAVSGDRCYVGMQRPFGKMRFDVATASVAGTYVVEYWDGAAWTALTVTDGTSSFTVDGQITWTIPGGWATKAVNSVTMYWVRVRATGLPSTTPTINSLTVGDWLEAFTGTNSAAYRACTGNRLYLNLNDNGPGAGGAIEGRIVGYETMTAFGTGTNLFPTAAQKANGLFFRKSATANGTARDWKLVADHRTFYFQALTGDTALVYFGFAFGEVYSTISGADSWNTMIIGRSIENTTAGDVEFLDAVNGGVTSWNSTRAGHYVARRAAGTGGSLATNKTGPGASMMGTVGNGFFGQMIYPNSPDGGLYLFPLNCIDNNSSEIRGRYRGLWHAPHALASFSDGDILAGAGSLAGKTFEVVKGGPGVQAVPAVASNIFYETSDTVEIN